MTLEDLAATPTPSYPRTLKGQLVGKAPQYLAGAFTLAVFQLAMNRIDWLSKISVDRIFGAGDFPWGPCLAMFGLAPDGGWFMYPPLTSTAYSPGINTDFWLLGIGFIEISAIAGAVELIVGILFFIADNYLPVFHEFGAWIIGCLFCFYYSATAISQEERASKRLKYSLYALLLLLLIAALALHDVEEAPIFKRDASINPVLKFMGVDRK